MCNPGRMYFFPEETHEFYDALMEFVLKVLPTHNAHHTFPSQRCTPHVLLQENLMCIHFPTNSDLLSGATTVYKFVHLPSGCILLLSLRLLLSVSLITNFLKFQIPTVL